MRDLANNIHLVRAYSPAAAGTDNTAIVCQIVDRLGYDSLCYGILLGANTDADATFAVLLEDGDDSGLSDAAAVIDDELTGTELLAAFTFGDDNETRKLGYVGSKRYSRLTITPTGNNSGNIYVAVVAILGDPHIRPTANPPI